MNDQHQTYWDSFYASRSSSEVRVDPSAFAQWVGERESIERPVVEFGFGNARDSLWFARRGNPVKGFDFATSAVRQGQGRADGEGLAAAFQELDLYDQAACNEVAKSIAAIEGEPVIYGRFLIHSLETDGRHNLLDLAATALADGGDIYLEFRTGLDQGEKHLFGDSHFRTYLDPELVSSEVVERGGVMTHSEAGYGLAVYKTEDPHVARLAARFGGGA